MRAEGKRDQAVLPPPQMQKRMVQCARTFCTVCSICTVCTGLYALHAAYLLHGVLNEAALVVERAEDALADLGLLGGGGAPEVVERDAEPAVDVVVDRVVPERKGGAKGKSFRV